MAFSPSKCLCVVSCFSNLLSSGLILVWIYFTNFLLSKFLELPNSNPTIFCSFRAVECYPLVTCTQSVGGITHLASLQLALDLIKISALQHLVLFLGFKKLLVVKKLWKKGLLSNLALWYTVTLSGLSCLLLTLIDTLRESHSWKGGTKPNEGKKTSGPHGVQQLSCFLVLN